MMKCAKLIFEELSYVKLYITHNEQIKVFEQTEPTQPADFGSDTRLSMCTK